MMEKQRLDQLSTKSVGSIVSHLRATSQWVKVSMVFCVVAFVMLHVADEQRWHMAHHLLHESHHGPEVVGHHRPKEANLRTTYFEAPDTPHIEAPPKPKSKGTVTVVSTSIEGQSGEVVTIEMQLVTAEEDTHGMVHRHHHHDHHDIISHHDIFSNDEQARYLASTHVQTRIVQICLIVGFFATLLESSLAFKVWTGVVLLAQTAVTCVSSIVVKLYFRDHHGGWPGIRALQVSDKYFLREQCIWLLTLWVLHGVMVYIASELRELVSKVEDIDVSDEGHSDSELIENTCVKNVSCIVV